ncbi:MAG: J domain-containing protein [Desulfobacterales bacterium]|nr:MAG: J domain-containing protein [Desulfobacterales bacterium]
MNNSRQSNIPGTGSKKSNQCLSCGTTENIGHRKYCSIDCRQKLRYTLNIRTGLLKALNIRYATFYFTDMMIIMDVLPYGSSDIFSFIYPRSNGKKPSEDYRMMSAMLGNEWWAEKNRTNKHYLASRHILEQAVRNEPKANCAVPFETKIPVVRESSLTYLKLSKSELNSPELEKIIKSAYRVQVKKHHPDLGGETDTFRKIHQAYLDLVQWAENPSYMNRRGFPDKWFYDGNKNKWVQPTPYRKP